MAGHEQLQPKTTGVEQLKPQTGEYVHPVSDVLEDSFLCSNIDLHVVGGSYPNNVPFILSSLDKNYRSQGVPLEGAKYWDLRGEMKEAYDNEVIYHLIKQNGLCCAFDLLRSIYDNSFDEKLDRNLRSLVNEKELQRKAVQGWSEDTQRYALYQGIVSEKGWLEAAKTRYLFSPLVKAGGALEYTKEIDKKIGEFSRLQGILIEKR